MTSFDKKYVTVMWCNITTWHVRREEKMRKYRNAPAAISFHVSDQSEPSLLWRLLTRSNQIFIIGWWHSKSRSDVLLYNRQLSEDNRTKLDLVHIQANMAWNRLQKNNIRNSIVGHLFWCRFKISQCSKHDYCKIVFINIAQIFEKSRHGKHVWPK